MNTDQIAREVFDLKDALDGGKIQKLNDLVLFYFSWLEEIEKNTLISNFEKDALGTEIKNEEFDISSTYNQLIDNSIDKLNHFVKSETTSFINSNSKLVFLSVLETLINLRKFRLSSFEIEQIRKTFFNYLAAAKNEEDGVFERVFKVLILPDPNLSAQCAEDEIFDVPSFGQNIMDKIFLKNLIMKSFGKNYSTLKFFSDAKIPNDIDSKIICPIEHKRRTCEHYIPATDTYFIAFPFDRSDIESQITNACDEKFRPLKGVIAKNLYENRTALCQICQMILSARFGVYVLTKHSKKVNSYQENLTFLC